MNIAVVEETYNGGGGGGAVLSPGVAPSLANMTNFVPVNDAIQIGTNKYEVVRDAKGNAVGVERVEVKEDVQAAVTTKTASMSKFPLLLLIGAAVYLGWKK